MPDQDAVVAITSESPDMGDEINLVWKYILPALKAEALPENAEAATRLKQKLETLSLDPPPAQDSRPASINSGEYSLVENERKFSKIIFEFRDSLCEVLIEADGKEYRHEFGAGKWIEDRTDRPGPSLTGPVKITDTYNVAGAYSWKDSNTLELVLRYIESPHHETITCKFDGDNLDMKVAASQAFGRSSIEMQGRRE
jgi:hypothetical protein